MTHSDDKGLVLPPRVAETQVIIIPVGLTAKYVRLKPLLLDCTNNFSQRSSDEDRAKIDTALDDLVSTLESVGVRAKSDKRSGYSPGWKFNQAEVNKHAR